MWSQRVLAGRLRGLPSACRSIASLPRQRTPPRLSSSPVQPRSSSHSTSRHSSNRLLVSCNASSAGEAGAKKAKRAGSKQQHQHDKQERHTHQQQHPQHFNISRMAEDDDEDDEADDEDNFLAPYLDAVIKVYCVHTEPNYSLPWQRKRQYTSTSTGFVAAGGERWLLTNAHSVDYATQVKVKKRGDDQKFLARVLALGVDCDIALLTVDDEAFWQGLEPLEFGPLPQLQDTVAVVGYPVGGDTISITAGVVSRIEVTQYSHGSNDLLSIQIDAAINSGNSGGPVLNKRGQCCGIAFQGLSGSDVENVGYVIPTPVVYHFLSDYLQNGTFTGFPGLGIQYQRMESDALRAAHGMSPGQKGVLVRRVNQTSCAVNNLKPGDVLLTFDGETIANDGTVPFRTGERIAFSHLVSRKFVGENAHLEVWRDGQLMTLDLTLSKPGVLVPPHLANTNPSYFLVGGLVFTPLCEPYLLEEYGEHWYQEAPVGLLGLTWHGLPGQAGQQAVLLGQVLAHGCTLGYEDYSNMQVLSVNGTRVVNLQHLAQLVTACSDEYLRFECDSHEVIVINRAAAAAGTHEVLRDHSIPAAMSPDIQQSLQGVVWPPPPPQQQQQQAAHANGTDSEGQQQQQQQGAAAVAAAGTGVAVEGGG